MVVVFLVVGVAAAVPRVRGLVVSRRRPQFPAARDNVRRIGRSPGRILRIFAGAAVTQLLVALAPGSALYAVGASAPFGGLVVVCTFTALVGGRRRSPVGSGCWRPAASRV